MLLFYPAIKETFYEVLPTSYFFILLTFKPSSYAQNQTLKNNYSPPSDNPSEVGKITLPASYMFKSVKVGNSVRLVVPKKPPKITMFC